jgi:ABC-type nitrate/sulfonate/bicarbonate transport system ATPase subunit
MITHDMDEALMLGHRIIVTAGPVVGDVTPDLPRPAARTALPPLAGRRRLSELLLGRP